MTESAALAEGNFDGKVRPRHGGHLWRVNRARDGWEQPFALPAKVNASDSTFSASIAGYETLYFVRPVNAGEKFHLYRSRLVKGAYAALKRVSFSKMDAYGDFDPLVSQDGSFLIFSSPRLPYLHIDPTFSLCIEPLQVGLLQPTSDYCSLTMSSASKQDCHQRRRHTTYKEPQADDGPGGKPRTPLCTTHIESNLSALKHSVPSRNGEVTK